VELIELLLKRAVDMGASDIFITAGIPPAIKLNNEFIYVGDEKLAPDRTEAVVKYLLGTEKMYSEFQEDGEKDFSLSLPSIGRFRINAYMQRGSMAAAIRVHGFEKPDPQKLGIPDIVLDFRNRMKGLVLVTGPTGSGKSTTLASMVNLINEERQSHIITLEDPIEYLHKHNKSIVDQREIGIDTKSYDRAIRAALRQSPDVILVGEMRDLETISTAITAAETGHLVLSTLHTIGASKTIDRIIDVFPPNQQQQIRVQLSTVLQAVVSQQLLPSASKGKAAAFEIMMVNNAIRNMIREGKTPQIDGVIQTSKNMGMVTMDTSIANLYKEGDITYDDAMTFAVNPDIMLKLIGGNDK
jgi:twitching motility protein PilT